jgi:hypothetical protein
MTENHRSNDRLENAHAGPHSGALMKSGQSPGWRPALAASMEMPISSGGYEHHGELAGEFGAATLAVFCRTVSKSQSAAGGKVCRLPAEIPIPNANS